MIGSVVGNVTPTEAKAKKSETTNFDQWLVGGCYGISKMWMDKMTDGGKVWFLFCIDGG